MKNLVSSIQYELELLQDSMYNNSFQLLAAMKDIESINMSIFHIFHVIAGLNDSSSNLFELVNQL